MEEVLINGAGLIGAETARLLSARGQPCTLFDLRPPPAAVLSLPGVRFVVGDLTDAAALSLLFERRFAAVLHTAAMLSTGLRADPVRGLEVNILGTARLLDFAARAGGVHLQEDPFLARAGTEELVNVRDCGRAMLAALDAQDPAQGVYAVAHPRGWTLDEVAAAVAARFGAFTLALPEAPRAGFAGFRHVRPAPTDLSAAERELGFRARHDLADTLAHWWR